MTELSFNMRSIAVVHSCFKDKFAIPRQPALALAATAEIEMLPPFNDPIGLEGLQHVSHLWLTFVFHQALYKSDAPPRLKVRPPRLGGNEKVGVFATRATHRPNPIGLSVVTLDRIEGNRLFITGHDLLDQTPILDIKPYLPYVDCVEGARNQMAANPPDTIVVSFSDETREAITLHEERLQRPLKTLIKQILSQDPKPAYQTPTPDRIYGANLWDLNVTWRYKNPKLIQVEDITLTPT